MMFISIVIICFTFLAVGAFVSKFLAISTFQRSKPATVVGDVVILSAMVAMVAL